MHCSVRFVLLKAKFSHKCEVFYVDVTKNSNMDNILTYLIDLILLQ